MNIFNSLGSNYNLRFVLKTLFAKDDPHYSARLKSYLDTKYQGKTILVYKGREAIGLALNLLNLAKDTPVAINGFTCYAVYQAIVGAGCKPEYLDIENFDFNFSPAGLKTKLREKPNIKVLIVQNTLGYPCDIEKLVKICEQNKIILIEDLAHSVGTRYKNNAEAGTIGDLVVLSFSQDKMIDGISGGALVIRNQKYQEIGSPQLKEIAGRQQIIDRLYPFFTYVIRGTYRFGIGKVVHTLLKKVGLLSQPVGDWDTKSLHGLPGWYAELVYRQFKNLENDLKHRKQIVSAYARMINPKILFTTITERILDSSNLRFPIFVRHRDSLIKYLKRNGIYVSDIWYDAPIAPKKYLNLTDYRNQCPEAEKVSSQILNLPTHKNVSENEAEEISKKINLWLKSQ